MVDKLIRALNKRGTSILLIKIRTTNGVSSLQFKMSLKSEFILNIKETNGIQNSGNNKSVPTTSDVF